MFLEESDLLIHAISTRDSGAYDGRMRFRSGVVIFGGVNLLTAASCAPLTFTFQEETASSSSAASSSSSSSSGGGGAGQGGAGGAAPGPVCGDGMITPPEACDDGNTLDGDACSSNCLCGDSSSPVAAASFPGAGCYVMLATPLTWTDGNAYCISHGWHLATVDTAAERDVISQAAKMVAVQLVWLGGTDAAVEGTWAWANGAPWNISPCDPAVPTCDNAVNLWAPNEPNDMLDEDCLSLDSNANAFNDLSCADTMYPLCEL